nr:ribonuclease H-like domain-containing protein [Tanacetum cinerariifolium]
MVTRPRLAHPTVTKSKSPTRRHITHSPSPKTSNLPPRVTAAQAPMDKGVIDSGCSRHMIRNISYLSDFEELNGGYVSFGGNPKGGKIYGKEKIKTSKLDFDDVYFVKELRKQDDKTKKEAKGKRDLTAEFKDFSDYSSNEVNIAGSIVPTIGQNSSNNTNPFSTVGPSNAAVSPTYGKSSFIDASQLLDDLDMLELEDITYSDDEDVVGAEADFNNLESS